MEKILGEGKRTEGACTVVFLCLSSSISCRLSRFDCSNNQLKDLPGSLGRCLELSDLKVRRNSDLIFIFVGF